MSVPGQVIDRDAIQLSLATENVTPTDLAYLAGLFDGEGCIRLELIKRGPKQKRRARLAVHLGIEIANTYEPIMGWLTAHFGGRVYMSVDREHPNKCWSWRLFGHSVKWLANLMLPYVIIKRDELELLIVALNLKRGSTSRPHPPYYYRNIEELANKVRILRSNKKQSSLAYRCHPTPNKEPP